MKKHILKISVFPIMLLSLMIAGNTALASEATGTLTTGISATNGNPMNGVVIAPPIASPAAGSFSSAQSVTLTADSAATGISYTTNGTAPTCSAGNNYSGPIAVNSSMTITAISCYPTSVSSLVISYLYTINIPATPSVSSGGGGSASITATVGISNFVTLMANWGKTGVGIAGDFNGDGKVDIMDFVWLMANWTK